MSVYLSWHPILSYVTCKEVADSSSLEKFSVFHKYNMENYRICWACYWAHTQKMLTFLSFLSNSCRSRPLLNYSQHSEINRLIGTHRGIQMADPTSSSCLSELREHHTDVYHSSPCTNTPLTLLSKWWGQSRTWCPNLLGTISVFFKITIRR